MIQGDVAAYFESGNQPRSVETISYMQVIPEERVMESINYL